MGYRDYDDDYIDRIADQYFSRVYDSPEERMARSNPSPIVSNDDGYDEMRDTNVELYGNPKGLTNRDLRWGSWDR